MKTYNDYCDELEDNGGIIMEEDGTFYFKPRYVRHRVDGPASELNDGDKQWYYNNEWIMDTKGDVTPKQLIDFRLRII